MKWQEFWMEQQTICWQRCSLRVLIMMRCSKRRRRKDTRSVIRKQMSRDMMRVERLRFWHLWSQDSMWISRQSIQKESQRSQQKIWSMPRRWIWQSSCLHPVKEKEDLSLQSLHRCFFPRIIRCVMWMMYLMQFLFVEICLVMQCSTEVERVSFRQQVL